MNNKKTIMILILVLFVGIIGLTVAYFSNSTNVDNIFETKPYGNVITEEFTSPSNWLPGSEVEKSVVATNTGEVDQAVRIKLNEIWTPNKAGSTLNGWIHEDGTKSTHETEEELENDERVAIINFDNASDWTYSNGYYYYNYKLSPNESTSSLIKSVTFNSKTKLDDTCVTTEGNGTKTITCNSSGEDYDNATYTLSFTIETVQYNKYTDAWNTDVEVAETKQRMLKGLKVNVADATFENGDKTALFEFSHPATEQTPALTDYRYIGHMPNNYVKYNCDNDGTNCEIWRIIGVFSVDDGNGNYEQRIKLVRENAFDETMQWDDRGENQLQFGNYGENNWDGAKLNIFLNGDYLTRQSNASDYGLKALAQSQIEDAKYYLGGRNTSGNPELGTTNDMYDWERGTNVADNNGIENSIFWIGKVALLYPSDYGYTYSKGVEEECYGDLTKCFYIPGSGSSPGVYNHPEAGWMYNNNYFFLLSHNSDRSRDVFSVDSMGKISGIDYACAERDIRPVVYLKSSINIISGEGTEQNPYTLSSN